MPETRSDDHGPIGRWTEHRIETVIEWVIDHAQHDPSIEAARQAEREQAIDRLMAITRRHATGLATAADFAAAATSLRRQFDAEGLRVDSYGVARKRFRDGGETRAFALLEEAILRRRTNMTELMRRVELQRLQKQRRRGTP